MLVISVVHTFSNEFVNQNQSEITVDAFEKAVDFILLTGFSLDSVCVSVSVPNLNIFSYMVGFLSNIISCPSSTHLISDDKNSWV